MKKVILVSLLTLGFVPARCEEVQQQVQDITLQQQQPKGGVGFVIGVVAGVRGARGGTISELIGIAVLGVAVGRYIDRFLPSGKVP